MLYKLPTKVLLTKSKQSSHLSQNTSGFTLIEILVVIALVGILSAIAAPSWLSFVARQRLNKANDTVLAALQEAQSLAKKNKRSYSVSIQVDNNNIPQISVYPGTTPSNWRDIGADLQIDAGDMLLFSNLNGNNSATNPIDFTDGLALKNSPKTITFDYRGALELPVKTGSENLTAVQTQRLGTQGLIIALAVPQTSSPTTASDTKRCVIVQTLIGGIRTAKDDDCN